VVAKSLLGLIGGRENNGFLGILKAVESWSAKFTRERSRKEIALFYVKSSKAPDLASKYVYFPLHFQPELTSSPLGGVFVDQIVIAQLLNAALPKEFSIFVKEHPKQAAVGRDIPFYQDLLDIRTVKLIDKHFDSRLLIKHSVAVATISGTAGWEALFLQKPVLMFGNFFYQYADGVYSIRTVNDCKDAIKSIVLSEKPPVLADMRLFLKAVETCSHVGYVDGAYAGISMISEQECVESILSAIHGIVES
jgi:CDP-glycerol glycerophosphotransferase (TagB/SpsB family)